MATATANKAKKACPICGKSLSYGSGFSKHGYQIKHHQHTLGICFGSYKPEEKLVERYIEAMETWLAIDLKDFPNEWLELAVTCSEHKQDKVAYAAFRSAKQLRQDIRFFKKRLQRQHSAE